MNPFIVFTTIFVLLCPGLATAQQAPVSAQLLDKMQGRAETYSRKFARQTEKYLRRLERQEEKLYRKLARVDSGRAAQLFAGAKEKYAAFKNGMNSKTAAAQKLTGQYQPNIDSMGLALNFLGQNNQYLNGIKNGTATVKNALADFNGLKQQLKNTGDIEQYIKERKRLLKEAMSKYGLDMHLKKFSKEGYYAVHQFNEYKEALNNTQTFEKMTLDLLNKIPAFKEFARNKGMLGNLFAVPAGYGTVQSLAGLQTRASVNAAIRTQLAAAGPNAAQQLQQNFQQAQAQLTQLKEKILKAGGQGSNFDIPDFKVNSQRTKFFWQRLSLNTDIQPVKGGRLLPNGLDIGLGLSYKIDDKKVIGAQGVYKAGLGNGLNNIKLSHQGVGFRLYGEVKFKRSFWFSAGYERNYMHIFLKIAELRNVNGWQESALAGISKKYKIGKKKSGEMKLLYNFLWKEQVNGQRIVWRTGFSF
jgi:hypothetical protein